MSAVSVSLVEFLQTGRFGPLLNSMTQANVEDLLGPPDGYDEHPDSRNDRGQSSYWMYGDVLEMSFRRDPPYYMNWFQLEHLQSGSALSADFGGRLSLELNGLTWRTPPSGFIGRLGSGNAEVQFELAMGHISFRLFFGDDVEMFFVSSDPAILQGELTGSRHSLARTLRNIESHSLVECIYSFPQPYGREERLRMRTVHGASTTWMTGNEYLALISE